MGRKKKYKELIELEVDAIAFQGSAVARKDGLVYFVKGAAPGDKVKARILRKKRSYYEARVEEIIEKSVHRIEPECKYFGVCGGCSWQMLDYEEQLYWKKQHVRDAFERIAKVDIEDYKETAPSINIFNYRNKMEFSFGASRWLTEEEISDEGELADKHFALGLHTPGRYDKVLDIDSCHIHADSCNPILNTVKQAAKSIDCKPYDQNKHVGFLRNLVLRTTSTGEIMLILVTHATVEDADDKMIAWLDKELPGIHPEITTIIHAVNDKPAQVAVGEPTIIKGEGYITEEILDIKYRISPFSFFQTNSGQLNSFISMILEAADIQAGDMVWDLYCGAGSITLPAAKKADKILGIELVESSIHDAKANAERNNIGNAEFFCADLHAKNISEFLGVLPEPDTIIIDPPRAGMHVNLLQHILKLAPKKIVYVSCNPATQARDCELMSDLYKIESVQPVDMFPHTSHVESIAILESRT